jgi:integrase/recombinase XerD
LFLSKDGGGMEQSTVRHWLRGYQRKARIKKRITGHVFRHTLATEMLRAGADLRHIQEMLGHEDLTTTQRYLRVVKEELKRVHHATHPREQMPTAPVHYRGSNAVRT